MQNCQAVVRSKKTVIGNADYKKYDNLAEAASELGDARVLDILNIQVKTLAMNALRAQHSGKTNKTYFRNKALESLTQEEIMSVLGDATKFNALLDKKAADLQAAHEAAYPTPEGGEEDDDAE